MTKSQQHPFQAKLDLEKAEEIRARARAGESPRALARELGLARSSIYEVINGKSHRPRLVVHLAPRDLARLDRLAREADLRTEEFAARCIERELGLTP